MKPKLLLIGAGGHCKVVLDLLLKSQEYEVVGIVDLKDRLSNSVFGVKVIGTDLDIPRFFKQGIKHCFISIGSVGDPGLRMKIYNLTRKFKFPNLIHPSAIISCRAVLGDGNYIAPGVIVNAGTQIGNHCILNTGAIIEHDCKVGDFVHLSPGVVLSGGVTIGDYSHIGTGSVLIQGVKVGTRAIVGAGSVVMKNVRSGMVVYGNPCKERKTNA